MKRKLTNYHEVQTTPKGFNSESFKSPNKINNNNPKFKLIETSDRILRSKKINASSSSSKKYENKLKNIENLNIESDLYSPTLFTSCLNTVDDRMALGDSPRMITSSVLR
jgi:hypothetical protein